MIKSLALGFALFFLALSSDSKADSCSEIQSHVSKELHAYSKSIHKRREHAASKHWRKIRSHLENILNVRKDCQDEVLSQYLIEVSNLYDWTKAPRRENGEKKIPLYTLSSGPVSMADERPITESMLERWVKLLLQSKSLIPLTPKLREDFGGVWNQKNDNRYSIYGAYDCSSTQIYYDPYLAPFDLASALVHEVGHLLRDKGDVFNGKFSKFNLEASVYLDELFSTLQGAYYQARLMRNRSLLDMYGGNNKWKSPLDLNFDLTMTDPQGDLHHLLSSSFEVDQSFWQVGFHPWHRYTPFPNFMSMWLKSLRGFSLDAQDSKNTADLNKLQKFQADSPKVMWSILNKVIHAYGADIKKEDVFTWVKQVLNEFDHGSASELAYQIDPLELTAERYSDVEIKVKKDLEKYFEVKDWPLLYQVERSIKNATVTPVCTRSMEALRNGELRSYLGSSLLRTGGEGSRTGGEGSRTGGEGSRTGGEGSRTGGEGSRTGGAVRACIHTGI